MKKLLLFAMLFASAGLASAQATSGFHRVSQVITRGNSGVTAQVVPSARVFVQNTSTGLAAVIYSDPLLTLTIPGAIVTSDVNGNYGYYTPLNTCYTENISSPSQGSLIIPNICGNSGLSLPLSTLNGGTGTTTAPLPAQILVGQSGSAYLPETMIGDCTLAANATMTCLKTNGVSFTAAATTPLGTSGATLCLLSSACTWAQNQTFSGTSAAGTTLGVVNTTGKNWQLISRGSSASDPGHFDIVDATDSVTALSLTNTTATLFGSTVCTSTNGACSGSIVSFAAPSGSWPTWLVPTVTNPTTAPSLAVAAGPIPNSALVNATITINTVACTLGGTCSITGTNRTCNANGCYVIAADGTITQWGSVSASACGGANDCSVAVVFPFPFTTTSNLTPTTTLGGLGSTGGKNKAVGVISGTVATTGFTAGLAAMIYVGGSGGDFSGSESVFWTAVGN